MLASGVSRGRLSVLIRGKASVTCAFSITPRRVRATFRIGVSSPWVHVPSGTSFPLESKDHGQLWTAGTVLACTDRSER